MNKLSLFIAILAMVIASGVAMTRSSVPADLGSLAHEQKESFLEGLFAGTNRQLNISRAGAITVGTSGTSVSQFQKGNCALIAGTGASGISASHAASTTKPYDCAVTGLQSTDTVIAQLATSTIVSAGGQQYWSVIAAKASSTNGYLTVLLRNNGPAAVPSATGVGSSTAYMIAR